MANKNFKARIGIEAPLIASDGGTTAITLSGADVTVVGDLTVSGTTTTLDTQNLLVEDKNVIIGNVAVPSDTTADGGGITLKGLTDKTITWLDSNDSWNFNQNIVNTGNIVTQGNLDVQGGTISRSTGALQITTTSNGDLTLAPNGTGNVVTTRNYIKGSVRDATTLSNGDMYSFSNGGGGPTRGLSIDNSIDTNKRPGLVLRAYGASLGGANPQATFITETAKGSAATPTGLASGNSLGSWLASGYADTTAGGSSPGWPTDTTGNNLASVGFITTEAFTSGTTNLGTQCSIRTNPTGSGNAIQTSMAINPQSIVSRSDAFTWQQGKTGTATNMTLNSTGQLTAYGNLTTLGTTTFNNELAVNARSELLNTNTVAGTTLAIQTNYRTGSGGTLSVPQTGWQLGNFRFNSNYDSAGSYVLGAQVTAGATENWTSTANGSNISFFANKKLSPWTTGLTNVASFSPETSTIVGDIITLKDSASVNLVGNKLVYNRVYGQWQYDATLTPVAANTAYAVPFQGTNAVTDFANIASAASTSRIIPGAAGMYKLQFSAQVQNSDNGNDHTAYFWWRKNGTDVTASMGRVTIPKGAAGGLQIVGWDNMISSANTTDYWELMYAVDDTQVTIPYFASTAFGPATAAVFLTLVPIGA